MKYRLSIVFLLFAWSLSAQQMSVKSFVMLEDDMDARIHHPYNDQNGRKCAIIKIVTTERGFTFDVGMLGVQKVEYKTAEIWVYVPERTQKIKIAHPQLGQLQTEDGYYWFPIGGLKQAACYRLELVSGRVITTVEENKLQTGWLILKSDPDGADVYLQEEGVENYAGTTPFQKKMPYGTYAYRLVKNLYHTEHGMATIQSGKEQQTIDLRPAHGFLEVVTRPAGARVVIDGVEKEHMSPCTTDKLLSGTHTVRITMNRYAPMVRQVQIADGQTTSLDVDLVAKYADLTIRSLQGADIYINGTKCGATTYNEALDEGIYDIEVRMQAHRTVTKQVQIEANNPQTITLEPIPIYGSLDVVSSPIEARISINGKDYGLTPNTIDNLLIGDYTVVLSKAGCGSVTRSVTITENGNTMLDETLPQGMEMTIGTGAIGDKVYVDGRYVGESPLTQSMSFGTHTCYADRNGKRSGTKTVNVVQNGATHVELSFFDNFTCTANGVSFEMVYVEGGEFMMGATAEQGSDAFDAEKPVHSVRLSDYYIGKYEVTQALWKAVMGTNPSYFTSNKQNPVEQVSWNDCQEFLRKLNAICHNNGSLPKDKNFYLPTEAQWEYAARGGKKSKGYKYSGSNSIDKVAWYGNNSNYKTHVVGSKSSNELGIYDMSGNVYEWCQDWYGSYTSAIQHNPKGAASGSFRVSRGGSCYDNARHCRVSDRNDSTPADRNNYLGLRLTVH